MTVFTCKDGSQHPWSRRCDGIRDCFHNEDERDCEGNKMIHFKLKNFKLFGLKSYSQFLYILYKVSPEMCSCVEHLERIDLC